MAGPYYVRDDGNDGNAGTADTAGGAWKTVNFAVRNAANGVLVNDDTVYLRPSTTFTELITPDRRVHLRMRQATLDGTGGAAGSDIVNAATAVAPVISDGILANAVDRGTSLSQGGQLRGLRAQSCGGIGLALLAGTKVVLCSSRACGGGGLHEIGGNNPASAFIQCEAGDCTGTGILTLRGGGVFGCLSYDNTTALVVGHDIAGNTEIVGNTLEGCTTGLSYTGGASIGCIVNNIFSHNTTGATSANDLTALTSFIDYNDYFGNTTDRNANVPAGTHDMAVDPLFVNAGGDDYTLDTGSGAIGTGFPAWKSPNKISVGATIAELATVGGSPLVGGGLVR